MDLSELEVELNAVGLALNFEKCTVFPSAGTNTEVLNSSFPRWQWDDTCNNKFLGSAIGSAEFCEALAAKRANKAKQLQERISLLDDTQCGLHLLRSCAS